MGSIVPSWVRIGVNLGRWQNGCDIPIFQDRPQRFSSYRRFWKSCPASGLRLRGRSRASVALFDAIGAVRVSNRQSPPARRNLVIPRRAFPSAVIAGHLSSDQGFSDHGTLLFWLASSDKILARNANSLRPLRREVPGKPPEGIEKREPDEGLAHPAILKPRIILH